MEKNKNEEDTSSKEIKKDTFEKSSNINSDDIDKDTVDKLKGDLIGDTMYSESFVIKTLLCFENLEWTDELETDLCFLWDMTVEESVCHYLFSLSFPALICDVITKHSENRLIEILIGILSNICIPSDVPSLENEQIQIVIPFINSDDSLILIQVMRFIKIISYKLRNNDFINDDIIDKMVFILSNSINIDLLVKSLDAASNISNNCLRPDLVLSSIEAFKTICNEEAEAECNIYKLSNIKTALTFWLFLLRNVSTYIETVSDDLLNQYYDCSSDVSVELCKVLLSYVDDDELEFSLNEIDYIIEYINYIVPALNITSDNILRLSLKLFCRIIINDLSRYELKENLLDLLCYLISKCDVKVFKSNPMFQTVLDSIHNSKFQCNYLYKDNLNAILNIECNGNH